MFKNSFQSGFLSIFYSIGSRPLDLWGHQVRNGHVQRITDEDILSTVLEVARNNISTTFITCPADPKNTLGIRLPFLVVLVKNLKKDFTFEVEVLDHQNIPLRFRRISSCSTTRVNHFSRTLPVELDDGWNQIQMNLQDFTKRAYGTSYTQTLFMQTAG